MLDYTVLKGRLLQVDRDGVRIGRVVSIDAGPRKGLKAIRLASPRYEGRSSDGRDLWSWKGPEFVVKAWQALAPIAGVIFRGKVIPVETFVRERKAVR